MITEMCKASTTPSCRSGCWSVFERVLEPHALSVLDVENLRLHYAKTLEHWGQRFEEAADHIEEMFGDSFVRAWRLYLAGSRASFTTGSLQLFQVVFARGTNKAMPWTRGPGHEGRPLVSGGVYGRHSAHLVSH